jgi:hypothetical protein
MVLQSSGQISLSNILPFKHFVSILFFYLFFYHFYQLESTHIKKNKEKRTKKGKLIHIRKIYRLIFC